MDIEQSRTCERDRLVPAGQGSLRCRCSRRHSVGWQQSPGLCHLACWQTTRHTAGYSTQLQHQREGPHCAALTRGRWICWRAQSAARPGWLKAAPGKRCWPMASPGTCPLRAACSAGVQLAHRHPARRRASAAGPMAELQAAAAAQGHLLHRCRALGRAGWGRLLDGCRPAIGNGRCGRGSACGCCSAIGGQPHHQARLLDWARACLPA